MSLQNPRDLIVAWFASLGEAYLAAQSIANDKVQLVEIFPIGSKGHMVLTSTESLQTLNDQFSGLGPLHKSYIPRCRPEVINAYLSVEAATLNPSLLIAEAEFIGALFEFAQRALDSNLQILDLRMLRGSSCASYLFLTAPEEIMRAFPEPPMGSGVKVTKIYELNTQVKDLFSFQP